MLEHHACSFERLPIYSAGEGKKQKNVFSKMSAKLKNKKNIYHHSPIAKFLVPDWGI
jgi:hypothetical protein